MARLDFTGFRGPQPPYAFCKVCGSVSAEPWPNPLLVEAKRIGVYAGETTGGWLICGDACAERLEREERAKRAGHVVPGMPAEFRGATFDNYQRTPENTAAFEAMVTFLGGARDLYLCGGVGSGKTRMACSILNTAIGRGFTVAFVRVSWMLMQLQEAMHAPDEHAKLSDMVGPSLLVLDDVGTERGTDYSRRVLTTLYDRRRDLGRRTIWTSNGDVNQLAASLDDERLPSRIAGAADIVFVGGEDRRVEAAERRVRGANRP